MARGDTREPANERLGASWWGLEVGPPHRHPAGISQDMGPPKASPVPALILTSSRGTAHVGPQPREGGGVLVAGGQGTWEQDRPCQGQPLMEVTHLLGGEGYMSTGLKAWVGGESSKREGKAPHSSQFRFVGQPEE